jgi:hypothetical protein
VTNSGYKEITGKEGHKLGNLSKTKSYLVWYHHMLTIKDWRVKFDKLKGQPAKKLRTS